MSDGGLTPSQTVGPFFAFGLTPDATRDRRTPFAGPVMAGPHVAGRRIAIVGRVLDGDGAPVPDAMLELWQADGEGRYASPFDRRANSNAGFTGFGRSATAPDGAFRFETVKPGRVPAPGGGLQAPHIAVTVFARGMLLHAVTRIYFDDEPSTADDPILALVPDDRRASLIARSVEPGSYVFDVHLQGPSETVFFEH